jgi:hypothetical protein
MNIRIVGAGWLLLGAALAAGCNGRAVGTAGIDGTGAPMTPSPTPAAAPIIAYGTITALGSVWVNGVHFDTSHATITVNGRLGTQSDLSVGDVALVRGATDADGASVASYVAIDSAVQGPIFAIDLAEQSFVVLGQTVRVDGGTSFADEVPQHSMTGLSVLDVVEVFGFRSSNGDIHATRIGLQPFDQREFETTGTVSDLDDATKRFKIHSLVVDYSSALVEGFANGVIADGDAVKVKGVSVRSDGEFVASSVANVAAPWLSANVGDRVEVEGFIDGLVNFPIGFEMAGLVVKTDQETVYEGGAYFGIAVDVKVEIEGTLLADGAILASKIRFIHASPIEIAAQVESSGAPEGSFVALGVTVSTDVFTRIEDTSEVPLQPFQVSSLVPGDYVSVRGVQSSPDGHDVLASMVERTDARSDVRLKGYVESILWNGTLENVPFTILGVTISSDAATHFLMPGGAELSPATFFFDLTPGALLVVHGTKVGDKAILATDITYIN